ncbi:MAG: response regulator transcription factor [bacterium]
MIDVLLADDHVMLREGICARFESSPDIRIAAEAGSTRDILKFLRAAKFHVILLDIKLADGSGMSIIRKIRRLQPKLRIIMLTMYDHPQYAIQALKKGAHGYVVKGAPVEELMSAIRAVVEGRRFISPVMADKLEGVMKEGCRKGALGSLSHREFEVLTHIASGLSVKEVAKQIGVSQKTVTTYRTRLMEKLNLANNAEIVRYALDALLID